MSLLFQNVPDYDVEHSETLLYHIRLLEELGESSQALSLLDVSAKSRAIVDRTAIMEIRGVHLHFASNFFLMLKIPCSPFVVET